MSRVSAGLRWAPGRCKGFLPSERLSSVRERRSRTSTAPGRGGQGELTEGSEERGGINLSESR